MIRPPVVICSRDGAPISNAKGGQLHPDATGGQITLGSSSSLLFYSSQVQHVMEKWSREIPPRRNVVVAFAACCEAASVKRSQGVSFQSRAAAFYRWYSLYPLFFAEALFAAERRLRKRMPATPLNVALSLLIREAQQSPTGNITRRITIKELAMRTEKEMRSTLPRVKVPEAIVRKAINRELTRRRAIEKRWMRGKM